MSSDEERALAQFLAEHCPECGTPGMGRHLSAVGGCATCAENDPRPVYVPKRFEPKGWRVNRKRP